MEELSLHSLLQVLSSNYHYNYWISQAQTDTQPSIYLISFNLIEFNFIRSDSLHAFNSPGGMNAYQKAIKAVGEILMNYDYDKLVPIYGFGG